MSQTQGSSCPLLASVKRQQDNLLTGVLDSLLEVTEGYCTRRDREITMPSANTYRFWRLSLTVVLKREAGSCTKLMSLRVSGPSAFCHQRLVPLEELLRIYFKKEGCINVIKFKDTLFTWLLQQI